MTRSNLAVIHIAKKQLGLSEERYRSILAGFGAESASDIKDADFPLLMKHFVSLGFKNAHTVRPVREVNGIPFATERQLAAIRNLWSSNRNVYDKSRRGLEKFIERTAHTDIDHLTLRDASAVIVAIKKL